MAVDIRPYAGDGADLADLITRTWTAMFSGRTWFPIWDRSYIEWRLMDPRVIDRELIVSAYDGERLIGCIVAEETQMRVRGSRVRGSLVSYLSVDPRTHYRGVAIRLVDALREIHRQRGIRIGFGVTSDGQGSTSKRFWDGVQKRRPSELAFLGSFRAWVAVCDAGSVSRAGTTWFERSGPLAAALIPWGWINARGARVRRFESTDIAACRRLLEANTAHADIAMIWSDARLSLQLDHPKARTWVLDGSNGVEGVANGYHIDWLGHASVRVGFIEFCVAEGGNVALAAMLVAVGRALHHEGAQMIVLMEVGIAPRAALALAGFLPVEPHVRAMALLNVGDLDLAGSRTVHMAFT